MMKRVLVLFLTMLCLLIGGNPAWATIDTETCKVTYTATAGLTAYPYTFKIFEDSDLAVIVRDSAGIEYTQTLTTDYTVSGVGIDTGGTVTFVTAPYTTYGSGATVVIQSAIPYTQRTDFLEGGRFSADTLEGVLDKNTRLVQQVKTGLDRALKFPVSSTANHELPDPALHAGRLLRIDLDGHGVDTVAVAEAGVCPDFTAYCDPSDLMYLHRNAYQPIGYARRSKFTYINDSTFTIGPGVYNILGPAGGWRTVFWSNDITFEHTAASTGWYYLCISDSASAVDAPRELTATDFTTSTTAPTWNASRQGWYCGNDRCIFAYYREVYYEIRPFYHDGGDYVQYKNKCIDRSTLDLDSKTAVPLSLPSFSKRGKFSVAARLNGAYEIRIAAESGGSSYTALACGVASTYSIYGPFEHYVSNDTKLYLDLSETTGTNIVSLWTLGWYFPTGM